MINNQRSDLDFNQTKLTTDLSTKIEVNKSRTSDWFSKEILTTKIDIVKWKANATGSYKFSIREYQQPTTRNLSELDTINSVNGRQSSCDLHTPYRELRISKLNKSECLSYITEKSNASIKLKETLSKSRSDVDLKTLTVDLSNNIDSFELVFRKDTNSQMKHKEMVSKYNKE